MYKVLDDKVVYLMNKEVKGEVDFEIDGNRANIYHTFVAPDLRGQGIAGELVKRAFEYLESKNYEIECSCSYAKRWALNHGKL